MYVTPGTSRESCQREYAHPDAIPNPGFTSKIDNGSGNFVGATSSPRPGQIAADSKMKNGTSDPTADPSLANSSRARFVSKSWLSASKLVAASLLPPPNPAPCGTFLD